MNKLFKISTLAALLSSASAYAHHPAADMVDPEVYAMIEENISDAHLALDFDDMGGSSTDMSGAMGSRDDAGNMTTEIGNDIADIGADMSEAGSMMASIEPGSMSRR